MSILDTFFILFESDTSKLEHGMEQSGSLADKLKEKLKKPTIKRTRRARASVN
jgi:hypothetical protein